MKTTKNMVILVNEMAGQGDVVFRRVRAMPKGAVAQQGPLVVAHSETGHHHVAVAEVSGAAVLFGVPGDTMQSYLKVDRGYVDIVHQRPWDTHETLRLLCDEPGTIWEIRRQREHIPEGWRQVVD